MREDWSRPATSDNPPGGSPRSMDVASEDLEQALRDMFARRSGTPPVTVDPAGVALRRARRISRRRGLAGVAMVAVATMIASVLAVQTETPTTRATTSAFAGDPLGAPAAAGPTETPGTARMPVQRIPPPPIDVVVGSGLHTVNGQLIDLSGLGTVVSLYRSGTARLVVTEFADNSALWLLPEGGNPRAILSTNGEIVLAPDGGRVAWRDGARMFVAPMEDGRLGTALPASAPTGGRPAGFVGEGVLLIRDRAGLGIGGYDVWWPGEYRESWADSVTAIYGMLPDGRTVVGQAWVDSAGGPCLALLDAHRGLVATQIACSLPLTPSGEGVVSPDGRWLIANGAPARVDLGTPRSPEQAMVVDLERAFGAAPTVEPVGFRLSGEVLWTAPTELMTGGVEGELVVVTLHDSGPEITRVSVPGARPGDRIIPVHGCADGPPHAGVQVGSCR